MQWLFTIILSIPNLSIAKHRVIEKKGLVSEKMVANKKVKQAEDTLHYDGDNYTGVGLTSGGTFYAGVRFTPLAPCTVIASIFYHHGTGTHSCMIYLRGAGTQTSPGPILDSIPYTASTEGWQRINLTTPRFFDANQDFWFVVRITHAAGEYPLGVDAGPMVQNHGGFVSIDGVTWGQLADYGVNNNWNIRAIIHRLPYAHDIKVVEIASPGTGVWKDSAYIPRGVVKNIGTNTETFNVECKITDHTGSTVYIDTQTVSNLAPDSTREIAFASWLVDAYNETYKIRLLSLLTGDQCLANDTVYLTAQSYEKGEIAYDDFIQTGWWWVGSDTINHANGPNDGFAVRFTPYLSPPFYVKKIKVYAAEGTGPFQYIGLFGGTATAPDTSQCYYKSQQAPPSPYGWIIMNAPDSQSCVMTTSNDFWVVVKFAPGDTGPFVGGDDTPPCDDRSYVTLDFVNWYPMTVAGFFTDFMIRVVHTQEWGIEEFSRPSFEIAYSPNPTKDYINISYTINKKGMVNLSLYDITGRLLRVIVNETKAPGKYEINVDTKKLPSGVYFCKFDNGELSLTKKIILVK